MNTTRDDVLAAIIQYKIDMGGICPTREEIGQRMFLDYSTVGYHILRLQCIGLLTVLSTRAIIIPGESYTPPTWYLEMKKGTPNV